MQVLKFGGTSVASASSISRVIEIVAQALEHDRTIVVCSAIKGCTDTLIEIGRRAAAGDESFQTLFNELQERHHAIISELLPSVFQDKVRQTIDGLFEELGDTVRGIFLLRELSGTSLDAVQSYGELILSKIVAAKFSSLGYSCKWLDSRELVRTCEGQADLGATYSNVREAIDNHTSLFVVPGFIASDGNGRTSTLGRGGSDYTASLLAVGIKARLVEIWTDVPGIMTANPKIVPAARSIRNISYRAAQELSHFGAKVIYPPTIQPVVDEGIPIYVKDTFAPEDPGTLVEKYPPQDGAEVIGLSNSDNISLISLEGSGMVGIPGFSSRLFDALARAGINIILITQASSVHTMCIAISAKDAERAKEAADECFAYEISLGRLRPLKIETGYSIICLIGNDVIGHSGTTGRMMAALGKRSIPIRATAQGSSERNITVIVPSDRVQEAIRAVHREFFERASLQSVNLFIAGFGTVGKALVQIIAKNAPAIASRTGKNVRICGLSNSRRYVIATEGIDPSKAEELLAEGVCADGNAYFEALQELSLEGSVFVDCTANPDLGFRYPELFRAGYPVVTCNKIPFSSSFEQYSALKAQALKSGVEFRYETTAGAALPILETIDKLLNCGDKIQKIEAVISGTLGYIFDRYDGSIPFEDVVEEARVKGYTEPDPSIDLSGRDVLRKLLILSRHAGVPLEESQVDMEPVPDAEEIVRRHAAATSKGLKLRYIASLTIGEGSPAGPASPSSAATLSNPASPASPSSAATLSNPASPFGPTGPASPAHRISPAGPVFRASCRLEEVGPESPLYWLRGTDNAAVIKTEDYPSPLLIQGAGAGARQTAGGVLGDILAST